MTFEMIDRRYRPREIKLECEDCGKTAKVALHFDPPIPLCGDCLVQRELEAAWSSFGPLS